jgi:hypothetical protein
MRYQWIVMHKLPHDCSPEPTEIQTYMRQAREPTVKTQIEKEKEHI